MNKPVSLRCAIYTRKSSEEGLEQGFNSLHAQREACEAYVLSQAGEGWTALPTIYDDGGFSGGTMDRPGLTRLLEDIGRGLIDVVVVYKVDRLTRSLADFAKIVERFDAKGVSFVSVTQAFNTTSSMGRLTLNVLLSFAQFEREVTGERIRDKLAASKAKGLWMGGQPPLGYAPDGRTLKIVEEEAEQVRHIFRRYLELGSVHVLRDELEAQGFRSKLWTSQRGVVRGGVAIRRGALFHVLTNRIYVGEIVHKTQVHPGLHPPIVDRTLFDAVGEQLSAASPIRRRGAKAQSNAAKALLGGLVRDDAGHRMTTVHTTSGSRRYRYYVAAPVLHGRKGQAGSLPRVPAGPLEELVLDRSRQLGLLSGADLGSLEEVTEVRTRLHEVVVGKTRVQISWRCDEHRSASWAAPAHRLPASDRLTRERDRLILDIDVAVQKRGGGRFIAGPNGAPAVDRPEFDRSLVKALVRAESWKRSLVAGEAPTIEALAEVEGFTPAYARRMLRLAFLSPTLKRAILDGRAPMNLSVQGLRERGVPDLWSQPI